MSEGRTHVGELKVKRESTYAVTETGSFTYQRVVAGSFKPKLKIDGESLMDERIVPTAFDDEENVLGSQAGGGFSVDIYGEGLASALTTAGTYSSPNNAAAIMMRAAFGASIGAKGSLVEVAGTTTSAIEHTAGDAALFDEGQVIGAITNSGPGGVAAVECAIIRKKVGNVLNLWTTLASVPSAGSAIYGAETFYLNPANFGGDGESLYCEWVGENAEDQFKMRGCVPTMKLNASIRQLVKLSFDFSVNNATRVNSLAIDRTAPTGGHPIPVTNRVFYFGTNADADAVIARSILELEDVTMDLGVEVNDESGGGIETSYRKRMVRARPTAEIQYRLARSAAQYAAYYTERAANTKKYVHCQYGQAVASNGRGGILFTAFPRCRYNQEIGRTDADGFARATVQLAATRPRSYSGGVQAVMDSPAIWAVL